MCDTTLLRRLAKKTQFRKGRPPALSKELEDLLAETIIHLAEMGFGMAKFEVCEMTQYHLETNPDLKKKYRDFKFGEKWIDGYLHRYPNISLRTPTNVQASRAVASDPKSIDKFFKLVNDCYEKFGITAGRNIFNCDESGLQFSQGTIKILTKKGTRNPKVLCNDNNKKMITILSCCNADGSYLPTNVLYKSKKRKFPIGWARGGGENLAFNTTVSGCMKKGAFTQWFKDVFLKFIQDKKIEGNKVMFLVGHTSHISIQLFECAMENNVSIMKLPPHTSYFLQPYDVSVFKPLTTAWKKYFKEVKFQLKQKLFLKYPNFKIFCYSEVMLF